MDIVFIDMEDNAPAYEAESMEQWNAEGMPAGTTREFFARLGNVSGAPLTNVAVGIVGDHSYRVTLSFNEFGSYTDFLTLADLQDGKSKNLYIKLTMPNSIEDQTITNWLVVGDSKLPITYTSSRAITTAFNPYPLWEGERTTNIFGAFSGKPVHRFYRFNPIWNPSGSTPQVQASGKFRLSDFNLCSYFNANDRHVGYEEPIFADINCIPTPRNVTSPFEWTPTEPDDYTYEDRGNVFLPADFLNWMGNEPPFWKFFHRENNPAPEGIAKFIVDTDGLDRFKRTHFLMERESSLYHLEHLQPVLQGQQLVYYKAELRLLQEPSAGNPKGYNPFAMVYDEDSNRVVSRYTCWNSPTLKTIGGTGTGTGTDAGGTSPFGQWQSKEGLPEEVALNAPDLEIPQDFQILEKNTFLDMAGDVERPWLFLKSKAEVVEIEAVTEEGTVTFNLQIRDNTDPFDAGIDIPDQPIIADADSKSVNGFNQNIIEKDKYIIVILGEATGGADKLHIILRLKHSE